MRLALASVVALGLAAPLASAQISDITLQTVGTGFTLPLSGEFAPGQDDRIYIIEQNQADIEILDLNTGNKLATPFLDLTGKVSTGGERGLLGIAFHPDYASNGFVYVNYTNNGGSTRIERYTRSSTNPDLADPSSGVTILQFSQPQSNHNGGGIVFGPDGMLWIGTGDGGNFNDQGSGHAAGGNAQSGSTLLGKMLRIDVDGGFPYAIPADNPYTGDPLVDDEIWAFGLRNPFRYTFDRDTGDLWIGDVGQNAREEVTHTSAAEIAAVAAGTLEMNYGWRCMEGFLCTGLSGCTCNAPELKLPIEQYPIPGQGRSVMGGFVYRGDAMPDWNGRYFYADNSSNRVWTLEEDGSGGLVVNSIIEHTAAGGDLNGLGIDGVAGWIEGPDGELYLCERDDGTIGKIVPAGPFVGIGSALAGANGEPVHFGDGGVAAGESGGLFLRNAAPSATAGLFFSASEGSVLFKGGVLKTFPLAGLIILPTDATGGIDVTWTDTGGFPAGTTLITQFGVSDAGAPVGVALSNALRTTW